MYCVNYEIFIEDNDQCNSCEHYKKKIACPLIEALGQGVVFLDSDMSVTNCGFYKEYKRLLKIVRE